MNNWTFTLAIGKYKFMYTAFEGTEGIIVPPDTDLEDEAYVSCLQLAQSYWDYVESFVYLGEARREWYHSQNAREYVNEADVMYHAIRFLTQNELTKPEWVQQLVEDIKHGTPVFPPEEKRKKTPNGEKSGYVYLLKSEVGHYKIGRAINPESRQKTFGVQLPFRVNYECLIKTDNMKRLETELHERFSVKRLEGEWFDLAPEDVEYIKGLAS